MSSEEAPKTAPEEVKRGRGRPSIPKEERVDLKFHLVLMKEEMAMFKIAAKAEGMSSTAFFIRHAIDYAGKHPSSLRKYIPQGLAPISKDPTTYHYPLLLTAEARAVVDKEEAGARSEFIRTAALSMVFAIKHRNTALDAAIESLKSRKGVE